MSILIKESIRNNLTYDIDGVIFKSILSTSKQLAKEGSPRCMIAAKLKPVQSTTIINDIVTSVGRTGAITQLQK